MVAGSGQKRSRPLNSARDAPRVAKSVGLRYSTDESPGYTRVKQGKRFAYKNQRGRRLADPKVVARIEHLRIPPAWTDVWICPSASGHLQATGRDQRGRKQYRYHPRWDAAREMVKYERIVAFGRALPKIRRRVDRDLRRRGLDRQRVLAAVVRLMDTTFIRVGNEEYAHQNGSYGLTTMQGRHARVAGAAIELRFRGKSRKWCEVELADKRLAKIVRGCQQLPGQGLFQYRGDDGRVHDVKSHHVNEYLREASGQDFTAKDFRTWAGTSLALAALRGCVEAASKTDAARNVASALDCVAEQLGNTRAVCRKSYVHPGIVEAYLSGDLPNRPAARAGRGLRAGEVETLSVLRHLARREAGALRAASA